MLYRNLLHYTSKNGITNHVYRCYDHLFSTNSRLKHRNNGYRIYILEVGERAYKSKCCNIASPFVGPWGSMTLSTNNWKHSVGISLLFFSLYASQGWNEVDTEPRNAFEGCHSSDRAERRLGNSRRNAAARLTRQGVRWYNCEDARF